MIQVQYGDTIYTAVAEVDGKLIDGNSGHDVSKGKILGTFLGSHYHFDGGRYAYYRNGSEIYQLTPDGAYLWFCAAEVEDAFKSVWLN